jgi:hypothetical protein
MTSKIEITLNPFAEFKSMPSWQLESHLASFGHNGLIQSRIGRVIDE